MKKSKHKSMLVAGKTKFHGFLSVNPDGKTKLHEPSKEVKKELEKLLNKKK
jgi:hypothetical protein